MFGTQRHLYSTCSRWGLALRVTQILAFALGVTRVLAFLDTNMLVSPTQNCSIRGLKPIFHCDAKRYQHVGIFWRYLTLKFALAPTQNLKFALAPTPTPDASQWNIGAVGPSGVGAGVGHVHFMLFMSISFALGAQRKLVFQWNMGLSQREDPTQMALHRSGI